MTFVINFFGAIAGLRTQLFREIPFVHEVECSAKDAPSELSLLGIALFTATDEKNLAFVNLKDGDCSTSGSYSACVIDRNDFRNSKLVTLVTDLREAETRVLGCNITSFKAGKTHLLTWYVHVQQQSK